MCCAPTRLAEKKGCHHEDSVHSRGACDRRRPGRSRQDERRTTRSRPRFPKELGGPGGATNPEQLFAAGSAACFHSALRTVARAEKADVSDSAVGARVSLGSNDSGGFERAVVLEISLPALSADDAQALTAAAHQVCPYSNATRGNIDVTLTLVDE